MARGPRARPQSRHREARATRSQEEMCPSRPFCRWEQIQFLLGHVSSNDRAVPGLQAAHSRHCQRSHRHQTGKLNFRALCPSDRSTRSAIRPISAARAFFVQMRFAKSRQRTEADISLSRRCEEVYPHAIRLRSRTNRCEALKGLFNTPWAERHDQMTWISCPIVGLDYLPAV